MRAYVSFEQFRFFGVPPLSQATATGLKRDRDFVVAMDISSKTIAASAKRFAEHAHNVQKNVAMLSYTPNSHVDSMLHSIQFVAVAFL